MSQRTCPEGHTYEKTSSCPVCPTCSADEMKAKYASFPKIGAPAFRALDTLGIEKLEDLTAYSDKDLLALHGFGPRALRIIKERLEEMGMKLKE